MFILPFFEQKNTPCRIYKKLQGLKRGVAWTYPSILNMTKNPDPVQLPYIFWQSIRDKKETSAVMIKRPQMFPIGLLIRCVWNCGKTIRQNRHPGIDTYTKGVYPGCTAYPYYTRELKKI